MRDIPANIIRERSDAFILYIDSVSDNSDNSYN